jgi:sensor histidine kinase YesM
MDIFLPKNKKALLIVSHLVGWTLFVYITAPLINRTEHPPGNLFPWFFIMSYLFLMTYFYLNSLVFVPYFLSKKQTVFFIGITIFAYILFCFVIPNIFHRYFIPELSFRPDMPPRLPDFIHPDGGRMNTFEIIRHRSFGFYSRSSQFLVVFIISTGLKAISQWYAEKQRLHELENSMVQAELSFLKSQIHPHFLFNSLNSIYYLALSKDDKAPEAILSLSDFLRFVTTESDHDRIPLEKEVKMLEEYIHLQSLRASEKFELQFQLKGDFHDRTIMPLTFVPFVENAFKYGISAHINCFIHICLEVENGLLKFTCDNSIVSRINDRNLSAGIGLENIRKRLELAYPKCHSLIIGTDSLAFHVKLQINLA